ncbi:MAG: hypothetical protein ABIL09_01185, partial [Gemmatimonadota bacterium]
LAARVVRYNLAAYLVFLWCGKLFPAGWMLLQTAAPFYQANGAVLLVLGLAPLLYVAVAGRRSG